MVTVLMLDSNKDNINALDWQRQIDWLEKQLAAKPGGRSGRFAVPIILFSATDFSGATAFYKRIGDRSFRNTTSIFISADTNTIWNTWKSPAGRPVLSLPGEAVRIVIRCRATIAAFRARRLDFSRWS